jgi:LysM repeat protein
MRQLSPARLRHLGLTALVCLGLILAACTRSASTAVVPTDPPAGNGSGVVNGETNQEATMAAIGTEVAAQLTQTAVAVSGVGGGDVTPFPTTDPNIGGGTGVAPTADPNVFATATQGVPLVPPTATIAVPVAQPTAAPPAGVACSNPYIVQQGDWIYKIARACGVSPQAIIAANPGINPHAISPGQQLNMPAPGSTTPPTTGAPGATCTGTRTVVTGDTLFRLSYNCGLTVEQLASANGIVFPYTIYPGQVIRYP